MKELAADVWQLGGLPPNGINVYVIGDVLVDAATRRAGRRILRLVHRFWEGPPRKVDRVLADGDEVAGFRVIHAPGHSRGEVITSATPTALRSRAT